MRLRQQMERLIDGGVHQAVVLNLAPSGPLYGALADEPAFFTEQWWQVFTGVCRDGAELGFHLWFYDQLGFSGADIQGQLVRREPSFRGRALERGASLPCGAELLTSFEDAGQTVVVYAEPRGFDYLDATACAALLDSVHGEFERRAGEFIGTTIVGSFQDELPSMPTWSSGFADEFRTRRGYDVVPLLPSLWGHGDAQVRQDYQRTRAELAEEAFFEPLHVWHATRGLVVGCDQQHPSRAGYPLEATQQYADYLRTHRWFSAPGSDHWGDAKVHSSLAHLYDRPRTWVEAFHSTGWGGTLEETYDWLLPWLRAGGTLYNPHAVYYSTRGGRWEWAAPSTCWRQPYWRHYPLFARTVSRLCAALSWGDHVCDVAVLFPTATAQSELDLGRPEWQFGHAATSSAAQNAYLQVVGQMRWYEPLPGVLDRDSRDFDVLDDDSVVRGEAADGGLRIGRETYRAIVLPECTTLEPATAKALRSFAEHGGLLVAIGAVDPDLQDIAIRVTTSQEVPEALAALEKRVTASVPTLLRTDGKSTLLLVTSPSGTVQPGGDGWLKHGYDFDPGRQRCTVELTVRDVPGGSGPVALWDPGTGTSRPLDVVRDGDTVHLRVPLLDGPCVLVIFGPAALDEPCPSSAMPKMARPGSETGEGQLLQDWTGTLLPTLDNTWGDFRQPPTPGPLPVLLWQVDHRLDEKWSPASVSFGERGQVRDGSQWRPLVWSDSAGGPAGPDGEEQKGYVPEEFLDLGPVKAGAVVDLRFAVPHEGEALAWLSIGSTADKQVRWNGVAVEGQASPYSLDVQVPLRDGDNLLEVRLIASTARRLRASWSLRHSPEGPRPEWVTGSRLSRTVVLDQVPPGSLLQLGTVGRVSLRINGSEVARHGEFDNYSAVRQPRVRRYDVTSLLVVGDNQVELQLHEAESAVVVDPGWDQPELVTNGSWSGVTGGLAEIPHDPRWVQLRPRPHPLPEAVDGLPAPDAVRVAGPAAGDHSSMFRFALPPGATGFRLPIALPVAVDTGRLEDGWWLLDASAAAGTHVGVTVWHDGRWDGGLLWPGPIEVRADGEGAVAIGAWSEIGLAGWSGGLRYSTVVPRLASATLDLGIVRGTAEVRVNGADVGCRLWSPYSFALGELLGLEQNVIEVDVYNTLAPYIGAISPTRWVLPGQTLSGLLGPVVLRTAPTEESS